MDWSDLLANIPLFESLPAEDLDVLAEQLEELTFETGAEVFKQGDPGAIMYIVQDGAVDISLGEGKQRVSLATIFPGQYFGELSLFDGAPRSATATASKASRLLALEQHDLTSFLKKRPEAAILILAEMGERIRHTNEVMSRQVSRNVLEEEEEKLSFGDRIADKVAEFGGSWSFIIAFAGFMAVWMVANAFSIAWDPVPYMMLNLALLTVAALQAPVIMMSQNRQSTKDKAMAVNDFQVNLKNEIGIDTLLKGQAELLQRITLLEKHAASGPRATPSSTA